MAIARPVLIDERDGPCEICAEWAALQVPGSRRCMECGEAVGIYENMGGNGFQSPMPHHFHIEPIMDVMGRRPVHQELCLECYRTAWKQVYPAEKFPPPPRELTEPKMPKELLAVPDGELQLTGSV